MIAEQTDQTIPAAPVAVMLWDRAGRVGLELDGHSGLPRALLARFPDQAEERLALQWSLALVTDGVEVERQPYGLAYADTVEQSAVVRAADAIRHEVAGYDECYIVTTDVGGWRVAWEYRFRQSAPRVEVQWVIAPPAADAPGLLRDLRISLTFAPPSLDGWLVEAPGSPVRPGLVATEVSGPIHASEPSDRGSGMVIVHHPARQRALLLWPFSRTELSTNIVEVKDGAVRLSVATGLAGRLPADERMRYGAIELDLFAASWDELRPRAASWYVPLGVSTPVDTAEWIRGASIFEVQIGASIFWNGYRYSPYPTMRDLYDDLGRIAGLGFDCIQIMPRQPFPSYNVYDYADVTASYGGEEDLKRVVQASHALGMKVILDILMHGVIDADVIHRAADRVRHGPYVARLNEGVTAAGETPPAYEPGDYLVAWSRHILDFEEHWAGGSPGEHPLVAAYPEWFMRNSAGEIIGVYTKAFDVANVAWQDYFTASALDLVRRLDIDGFRFDAPTYNDAENWSDATAARASYSQLGSVQHFERLRPQLKALKSDALLYTEPSGALFRQSMDITYNYDEHWLIHAVLRPETSLARAPMGIRHARDLAHWMRDKDAVLPVGAITARHIDSHDTFWWPLPGAKWRREQYGLPATRALLATWSLIGGVYMTFVGGEERIEDDIRHVNRLRHACPEIRLGRADYDAVAVADERVFAVSRVHQGRVSIVLTNLSSDTVRTTCRIAVEGLGLPDGWLRIDDVWNDTSLPGSVDYRWNLQQLRSFPLDFAPYQPRVLMIRPAR